MLTAVLARQAAAAVGENVLAVGNCCYVAVCSAAEGAFGAHGGMGGAYRGGRSPTAYLFLQSYYRFCNTVLL